MRQKSAHELACEMTKVLAGQRTIEVGNAIVIIIASFIQDICMDESDIEDGCMSIAIDAFEFAKSRNSTLQ